jgi:hypothetical protein
MVVLAFDFVHFLRLTPGEILVGVLSVAACLLLFDIVPTDRPNR